MSWASMLAVQNAGEQHAAAPLIHLSRLIHFSRVAASLLAALCSRGARLGPDPFNALAMRQAQNVSRRRGSIKPGSPRGQRSGNSTPGRRRRFCFKQCSSCRHAKGGSSRGAAFLFLALIHLPAVPGKACTESLRAN